MKEQSSRLLYIDNLRALMIIFVVLVHSAVTYGGLGSWYYIETKPVDAFSKLFFFLFLSTTQAYFMSLLFMLAGYFVPGAFEKKGGVKFLTDRLFRLGVPFLVFAIILHPLSVKLAYPEVNLKSYFLHGVTSFDFISRSGPLWFVLTLLLFSFLYVLYRLIFNPKLINCNFTILPKHLLGLVLFISLLAFAIRLVYPIGTSVINLQFCFFAAYIIMFVLGIWSYYSGVFHNLNYKTSRKYLIIGISIGFPLWLTILVFGGLMNGSTKITGGMNWQSFAYALWESFTCVFVIIALLGIFRERFNSQNFLQKFLSDQAFGVFVFHTPILIGISQIFKNFNLIPLEKFLIVGMLALVISFSISYLVRLIPIFRKVFS